MWSGNRFCLSINTTDQGRERRSMGLMHRGAHYVGLERTER